MPNSKLLRVYVHSSSKGNNRGSFTYKKDEKSKLFKALKFVTALIVK